MRRFSAIFLMALVVTLTGCDLDDLENLSNENEYTSYSSTTDTYSIATSPIPTEETSSIIFEDDTTDNNESIYNVSLHVNFIPNLIFSTYDVDISLDGIKQSTLEHGKDADYEFQLSQGIHSIVFSNSESADVKGIVSLEITGDLDTSYTIYCFHDEVVVDEEYIKEIHGSNEIHSTNEISSTEFEQTNEVYETIYPVENARRAAIVALTNGYANDVFTDDGNYYDISKFHSYSDKTGYYLNLVSDGTWSVFGENVWHVDNLVLETVPLKTKITASLNVTYDGSNYTVSELNGMLGDYLDISEIETSSEHPYLTVTPNQIADDRDKSTQGNKLDEPSKFDYRNVFEDYGLLCYPYGFKCHWIMDLRNEEKWSDSSYFFKVGVTVKNAYGQKRDTVAEGVVKYVNGYFEIESFYVS